MNLNLNHVALFEDTITITITKSQRRMKRLVDLNHGALFEDTSGLVGSAPFKLGDQVWFVKFSSSNSRF